MTIYVVHAIVAKVEQKFKQTNHHTVDGRHCFDNEPIGWYVHFVGSTESIKLSDEEPYFKEGDRVKITFTK